MGGFHKTLGGIYKPIRKIVDPLNIMDPLRILPGSTAGFTKKGAFSLDPNFGGPLKNLFGGGGQNYQMPKYDFSAAQRITQNQGGGQLIGDLLLQKQLADQASASQQAANLQAANAQQQQNINAAMQTSKENLNNSLMRTPVPSTFSAITPASTNQFKLPNVAGLTFGK